jgi:hypothetical protein
MAQQAGRTSGTAPAARGTEATPGELQTLAAPVTSLRRVSGLRRAVKS